jgi:hypothetical protein
MAQTTIYDVAINYKLAPGSSATTGMDKLSNQAAKTEKSLAGVGAVMSRLGGVITVGAISAAAGMALAAHEAVKYNSFIEQSTIGIATQQKLLRGGAMSQALEDAKGLFQYYQQAAMASASTTQDFITMHKMIAGAAYMKGMGPEDVKAMTKGAIQLGTVFGEQSWYVGMELKEMMSGVINARQRIPQYLLGISGKTKEDWQKMNEKQRNELMKSALNSSTLAMAGKLVEKSFSGAFTTLKDNLQISLAKVGAPLFETLKGSMNSFNFWLETHPATVKAVIDAVTVKPGAGKSGEMGWGALIWDDMKQFGRKAGSVIAADARRFMSFIPGGALTDKEFLEFPRKLLGMTLDVQGAYQRDTVDRLGGRRYQSEWSQKQLADAQREIDILHQNKIAQERVKSFTPAQQEAYNKLLAPLQSKVDEMRGSTASTGYARWQEATALGLTSIKNVPGKGEVLSMNWEYMTKKMQEAMDTGNDKMVFELRELNLAFNEMSRNGDPVLKAWLVENTKAIEHEKKRPINVTNHIQVQSADPDRFTMGLINAFQQYIHGPTVAASAGYGGF